MIYGLEEYDITNTLEIESALSELDFNLIRENIREQIQNLDNNVDYISPIENKFRLIMDEYDIDNDIKSSAMDSMQELYEFTLDEIASSFDIDINYEGQSLQNLSEMAKSLYEFLVLKARKNITKFYSKFIIKNKKMLTEPYAAEKRKDLSSTVLKKVTKNKDDIIILSKCPAIFKSLVFNMDFDSDELMKVVVDTEYHGLNVKHMVASDSVIGNFMAKYVSMIRDNSDLYDDVYCRVYSKVSNKLIKN